MRVFLPKASKALNASWHHRTTKINEFNSTNIFIDISHEIIQFNAHVANTLCNVLIMQIPDACRSPLSVKCGYIWEGRGSACCQELSLKFSTPQKVWKYLAFMSKLQTWDDTARKTQKALQKQMCRLQSTNDTDVYLSHTSIHKLVNLLWQLCLKSEWGWSKSHTLRISIFWISINCWVGKQCAEKLFWHQINKFVDLQQMECCWIQ